MTKLRLFAAREDHTRGKRTWSRLPEPRDLDCLQNSVSLPVLCAPFVARHFGIQWVKGAEVELRAYTRKQPGSVGPFALECDGVLHDNSWINTYWALRKSFERLGHARVWIKVVALGAK